MFCALADTLRTSFEEERLLVIGFAETATAIGAAVAAELGADYVQTTRELVPDAEYLYFSEEHSHATEQTVSAIDIYAIPLVGCGNLRVRGMFCLDEPEQLNSVVLINVKRGLLCVSVSGGGKPA